MGGDDYKAPSAIDPEDMYSLAEAEHTTMEEAFDPPTLDIVTTLGEESIKQVELDIKDRIDDTVFTIAERTGDVRLQDDDLKKLERRISMMKSLMQSSSNIPGTSVSWTSYLSQLNYYQDDGVVGLFTPWEYTNVLEQNLQRLSNLSDEEREWTFHSMFGISTFEATAMIDFRHDAKTAFVSVVNIAEAANP